MNNVMKLVRNDCLIGNFVYELCSVGIWTIQFYDCYKWSDRNDLDIYYPDIEDFGYCCNFKIIATSTGDAIEVPPVGVGNFSSLEYLHNKYRVGLSKDIIEQIHQSVSDYLAGTQTSVFVNQSPACEEDKDNSICKWVRRMDSHSYTASCGEDYVPLMRGFRFCPYCGRKLEVLNT